MVDQPNFVLIFERLKTLFLPALPNAKIQVDDPSNYIINGGYSELYRREINLGGVTIRKNYVSYYLMPVYMFPELLGTVSPQLKKRMQGKSCFNFKKIEVDLLIELQDLTNKGIQRFRDEGYL